MDALLRLVQTIPWQEMLLPALGPLFIGIYLLEWQWMKKRRRHQSFTLTRSVTNFGLGASYMAFELAAKALIIVPLCLWLYQFRLFTIEVTWLSALPVFFATEFCYYWFHRASHRVRWFWSAHIVHHSDQGMNLSTAMRQSLLYSVTGWWLFFTPLMLLGVHPLWVFFFYALNLAYQFFIHTEAVGKLPRWIEYFFDTPSNHRAHHGRNPHYIDKNYGGVLMIFDHIFGTYVQEQEKVDYGIPEQIDSNNILTLNLHEFIAMWRDVLRPGSWRERIRHLWMPPEYRR